MEKEEVESGYRWNLVTQPKQARAVGICECRGKHLSTLQAHIRGAQKLPSNKDDKKSSG